jgi:predicted nucleic acid-binding protein
MIVVDTGAMLALIDRSDTHHAAVKRLYQQDPDGWILPWAILPEVDYLLAAHVSRRAEDAFLADLAESRYVVEWGSEVDLEEALHISHQYHALALGLVDATVMAVAERLRAAAIATLDIRHFGAVRLAGNPKLLPRDG